MARNLLRQICSQFGFSKQIPVSPVNVSSPRRRFRALLVESVTNPDSSTQSFTYNTAYQNLTRVDELGNTTTVAYNSLGRRTSVTDRVAAVTQFAYDTLSRVTKQTDAIGNITDIEYNNRGWVSKIKYPDPDGSGPLARAEDIRSYDGIGNLTSQCDPLGNYQGSTPYTYNADNLLSSRG